VVAMARETGADLVILLERVGSASPRGRKAGRDVFCKFSGIELDRIRLKVSFLDFVTILTKICTS
jgi:hypothetical protein